MKENLKYFGYRKLETRGLERDKEVSSHLELFLRNIRRNQLDFSIELKQSIN